MLNEDRFAQCIRRTMKQNREGAGRLMGVVPGLTRSRHPMTGVLIEGALLYGNPYITDLALSLIFKPVEYTWRQHGSWRYLVDLRPKQD